jgi:acetoin utilization deacetylase AcuC-like enzyme
MSKLKVFINEKQSTGEDVDTSFSPSSKKPAILVKQWLETGQPIEIVSDFLPVTREHYYRVHEKDHVDAILDCQKINGFYNKLPEIADTLPWTAGSFLAAATHAWEKKTITMSPTSGFHHATQNESMGFCTFNGLMVAATELLGIGAKKVGILDLDHHYGNGTADIIEWLADKGELGRDQIHHYTVGGDLRVSKKVVLSGQDFFVWQGGDATERWLGLLPGIIEEFAGCDIVLFQAGADPHVNDPCHIMLGAVGALTNDQFAVRDRAVFEKLSQMNIPIAWNLAGGYQAPLQKVLDIHTQTLAECLKVLG